ncbi:MAG: ABC transporter ATP-binding protein [Anaerolineae bacterium]|nr:ABC transporter ATP-binding protein [Anaerolineae bacterium]
MTTSAIQLTNVTKVYGQSKNEVRALDAVSLTVPAGSFTAIMGASGSGKSTLLHLVAGLATPTAGEVILFDQTISQMNDDTLTRFRRRHVGLIFQSFNLLPTMSALENVCLPELIDGKRMRDIEPKAKQLLAMVNLTERGDHRPDQLSGGQQQRVAIARALINDAPLLLADEPTGNLDSKTGESVLILMRELVKEHQRTIVMVTHDPKAAAYADRVITLSDGKIIDDLGAMIGGKLSTATIAALGGV